MTVSDRVPQGRHIMPNSYVINHAHIVFSTKGRLRTIREEMRPQLWGYMAGIAKNYGMKAIAVGGLEDHVHVLLDVGPILGIAKAGVKGQFLTLDEASERSAF